eukprot:178398_1
MLLMPMVETLYFLCILILLNCVGAPPTPSPTTSPFSRLSHLRSRSSSSALSEWSAELSQAKYWAEFHERMVDAKERLQSLHQLPPPPPLERASSRESSESAWSIVSRLSADESAMQRELDRLRGLRHGSSSSRGSSSHRTSAEMSALIGEMIDAGPFDLAEMQKEMDLSTAISRTYSSGFHNPFEYPLGFAESSTSISSGGPGLRRGVAAGSRSTSSSSLGPRPRDEVDEWLKEIEESAPKTNPDRDNVYKELEISVDFYRIGNFPMRATADGYEYQIVVPLYIINTGAPYDWFFYLLPKDFYTKANEMRGEGADLTSNMELKRDDLHHYDPYTHGGAEIFVKVNPYIGGKTAEIRNIHMKDGMRIEYKIISSKQIETSAKSSETSTKLSASSAITSWFKSGFKSAKEKAKHTAGSAVSEGWLLKSAKWTVAVSVALESLWKELGITKLKCSDQAFISCGTGDDTKNIPANPSLSMLFLRIFGKQKNSYYMKDEFGFDIDEIADDSWLIVPPHSTITTRRGVFDELVNQLHERRFASLMDEIEMFGKARQETLYAYARESYTVLEKRINDLKTIEAPNEETINAIERAEKEQGALLGVLKQFFDSIEDYKGLYEKPIAHWYKPIHDIWTKVQEANTKNTDPDKRVTEQMDNYQLPFMTMGDVMTMLWYRGNAPQCETYVEVFEFIYGKFDPDTKDTFMPYGEQFGRITSYGDNMHRLRNAVQDLVKYLPDDSGAAVSHGPLVPRAPRLKVHHRAHHTPKEPHYRRTSFDSSPIHSSWAVSMSLYLLVCALSCLCGLCCYLGGAYIYGTNRAVTSDKAPCQYEPNQI